MTIAQHEKVATIYQSLWLRGIHHGQFGDAHWVNDDSGRNGLAQINVKDGPSVLVWHQNSLWWVKHNDFIGCDPELETAALYAIEH